MDSFANTSFAHPYHPPDMFSEHCSTPGWLPFRRELRNAVASRQVSRHRTYVEAFLKSHRSYNVQRSELSLFDSDSKDRFMPGQSS